MSLLERRRQLEDLVAYATQARAGDGRLVLVAGEAGVGKSTLVEAAEAEVRESHTNRPWLWGRCDGQFTPHPLGPILEIAEQLGGSVADAARIDAPRTELSTALVETLRGEGDGAVLVVETSTGRTRPPSTRCGTWGDGSATCPSSSWRRTATTDWERATRSA